MLFTYRKIIYIFHKNISHKRARLRWPLSFIQQKLLRILYCTYCVQSYQTLLEVVSYLVLSLALLAKWVFSSKRLASVAWTVIVSRKIAYSQELPLLVDCIILTAAITYLFQRLVTFKIATSPVVCCCDLNLQKFQRFPSAFLLKLYRTNKKSWFPDLFLIRGQFPNIFLKNMQILTNIKGGWS